MTTLNSSVFILGPYSNPQSTPINNPGDTIYGGTPISGAVGMHGVYGMKNLRPAGPRQQFRTCHRYRMERR